MKTLFITSFNPFISRNLFVGGVLDGLKQEKNLRIVIFCPDYKLDYFKKNFSDENVFFEGIKTEIWAKQDVFFAYLGRSLINTKTLAIHNKEIYSRNKNVVAYLFSKLLSQVGWLDAIKSTVRYFDFLTMSKEKFGRFFDLWRPDVAFCTDMFHLDDVHVLAEAKRRNVFTIGMIRSWDNITNKGLFRVGPHRLIVHNEVIKEEALRYEGMKSGDIFVSGLPQFDYYVNMPRTNRKEFFDRIGLDADKTTILFAPYGKRFHNTDWQILEILKELPYQYIVRLPPNDSIDFGSFVPTKNFYIEHPGVSFKSGVFRDREGTSEDIKTLADSLYHCDVVLNYSSTISIDAVCFGKPVIIIAFDGWENLNSLKSVRRFLDYTHIRKKINTGYCKIAYNKNELIRYIEFYLKNPNADAEGRKRLIKEQVWTLDGKSSERISDFVRSFLI